MNKLIILGLLAIVLISGCTQTINVIDAQTGIGLTNIGEIVNNPEEYYQKNLTIKGVYAEALIGTLFLQDEQDYHIKLKECEESQRTLKLGETYKAIGIIKYNEHCTCEYRLVANMTEEEWESFLSTKLSEFPDVSNENISSWNTNYLFLPSEEEGWSTKYLTSKKDVSTCKGERRVFLNGYEFGIKVNTTHTLKATLPIIEETRCRPKSIEKEHYFECIEPMVKLS